MKTYFSIILLLTVQAFAQPSEKEIREQIDLLNKGEVEKVQTKLFLWEKQYSNNGGVLYLQAILMKDGAEALKKFQAIIDTHPSDIWADDALYKAYQYYYSIGLYKTADQKMEQLRKQYPQSEFLGANTPLPTIQQTSSRADTVKTYAEIPISTSRKGKFSVQIGVFAIEENAKKQIESLKKIGKFAIASPKEVHGKILYVVSLEGFTNEQDARSTASELRLHHNIAAIVVSR